MCLGAVSNRGYFRVRTSVKKINRNLDYQASAAHCSRISCCYLRNHCIIVNVGLVVGGFRVSAAGESQYRKWKGRSTSKIAIMGLKQLFLEIDTEHSH